MPSPPDEALKKMSQTEAVNSHPGAQRRGDIDESRGDKSPLDAERSGRLDAWQKEILKRWQTKTVKGVPQAVKDELRIRFDGEVLFDEPMARHTYIKIGGPADVFLKPRGVEAVRMAVKLACDHNLPYHFHGSGANTLVRDGGVRGLVISIYDILKEFHVAAETDDHADIAAEAGVAFANLVRLSRDLGLSGLEPLTGIPGSLGGLISMNAGTREREIKDVLRDITVLDHHGELATLPREKLEFEYRHLKISRNCLIVKATIRLEKTTSREQVEALVKRYQEHRVRTQPLEFPNLGSMFKNPQASGAAGAAKKAALPPAGQLIEEAGLKGVRVGGARISQKHANFIVNEGTASAHDVLALLNMIRDKVREVSGVALEPEIKIIGEDHGQV